MLRSSNVLRTPKRKLLDLTLQTSHDNAIMYTHRLLILRENRLHLGQELSILRTALVPCSCFR